MAQTLAEKVWERHVVHRADGEPDLLYVDLHLVHEVTSPQAFDGLRMHGRTVRRPDLTVATMDHNVPTTDGPVTDEVSARQMRGPPDECRRVRRSRSTRGGSRPGHRARDRSGDGLHAARHDDRLRRLAHLAPTAPSARSRSASARARSSTCSPRRPCRSIAAKTMAVTVEGDLPEGVCSQGRHPRHHQPHRHRRRRGPRDRVPRLGDPRALDGRPHDDLQHVDRGRRTRRHGRARRHHVRLRRGPSARTEGRRLGGARSTSGEPCRATRTPRSTPRSSSTRRSSSRT